MKKAVAFLVIVCMTACCFTCFTVPAMAVEQPETVYNLIPSDATITYTEVSGVTASATFGTNGTLVVKADGAWPNVKLEYGTPYKFDISKATLRVKFQLKNGGTSIRIGTPDSDSTLATNEIFVHHYIEGMTFDTAGDLVTPGTYEFELPFSSICYCDWTAASGYVGKLPIESDEITLSFIEIYSVNGAEVVIEKLEVAVEGEDIIDVSEGESEATSTTESSAAVSSTAESSQGGTPETGDSGLVSLVAICVLSLVGTAVIKKKR